MRYWHFKDDPEGRRFCFTTEPLYTCPRSDKITYEVKDLSTGEVTLTTRRPEEKVGWTFTRHVSDVEAEAARLLGVDGKKLLTVIQNAHRHASGADGLRQRVDGKLTDRCKVCGSKLTNHGYSAYVERDMTEEERLERGQPNMSSFGFSNPSMRLKGVNGLKRSEAREWAYEQYVMAKAAQQEKAR